MNDLQATNGSIHGVLFLGYLLLDKLACFSNPMNFTIDSMDGLSTASKAYYG